MSLSNNALEQFMVLANSMCSSENEAPSSIESNYMSPAALSSSTSSSSLLSLNPLSIIVNKSKSSSFIPLYSQPIFFKFLLYTVIMLLYICVAILLPPSFQKQLKRRRNKNFQFYLIKILSFYDLKSRDPMNSGKEEETEKAEEEDENNNKKKTIMGSIVTLVVRWALFAFIFYYTEYSIVKLNRELLDDRLMKQSIMFKPISLTPSLDEMTVIDLMKQENTPFIIYPVLKIYNASESVSCSSLKNQLNAKFTIKRVVEVDTAVEIHVIEGKSNEQNLKNCYIYTEMKLQYNDYLKISSLKLQLNTISSSSSIDSSVIQFGLISDLTNLNLKREENDSNWSDRMNQFTLINSELNKARFQCLMKSIDLSSSHNYQLEVSSTPLTLIFNVKKLMKFHFHSWEEELKKSIGNLIQFSSLIPTVNTLTDSSTTTTTTTTTTINVYLRTLNSKIFEINGGIGYDEKKEEEEYIQSRMITRLRHFLFREMILDHLLTYITFIICAIIVLPQVRHYALLIQYYYQKSRVYRSIILTVNAFIVFACFLLILVLSGYHLLYSKREMISPVTILFSMFITSMVVFVLLIMKRIIYRRQYKEMNNNTSNSNSNNTSNSSSSSNEREDQFNNNESTEMIEENMIDRVDQYDVDDDVDGDTDRHQS